MHLLAVERTEIYKAKSAGSHITGHFRENAITKWQTARLIPDIRPWIGRKFEEVSYYVTLLLSDQGYFRKHLHIMGKTAFPYCIYERRGNI